MTKPLLALLAGLVVLGSAPTHGQTNSLTTAAPFRSLTADRRARQVGDILTVSIQENASASSAVNLDTQRRSATSVSVNPVEGANVTAGAGLDNGSSGTGRIQRSGRLLAQITVKVVDILPNGNLVVTGEQHLDLNHEAQMIRLRGLVRPNDVDEHNVVQSTRVADAHIEFIGDGFLTDAGRPGLLARILSFFGL